MIYSYIVQITKIFVNYSLLKFKHSETKLVFAVRNFKQLKLLQAEFNESLKLSRLTRSMKSANIVVLFKKNDRPNKTN